MINEQFAQMISQYGDPVGKRILNELDDPKATKPSLEWSETFARQAWIAGPVPKSTT